MATNDVEIAGPAGGDLLDQGAAIDPHVIVLFFIGIASFIAVYIGYWGGADHR